MGLGCIADEFSHSNEHIWYRRDAADDEWCAPYIVNEFVRRLSTFQASLISFLFNFKATWMTNTRQILGASSFTSFFYLHCQLLEIFPLKISNDTREFVREISIWWDCETLSDWCRSKSIHLSDVGMAKAVDVCQQAIMIAKNVNTYNFKHSVIHKASVSLIKKCLFVCFTTR